MLPACDEATPVRTDVRRDGTCATENAHDTRECDDGAVQRHCRNGYVSMGSDRSFFNRGTQRTPRVGLSPRFRNVSLRLGALWPSLRENSFRRCRVDLSGSRPAWRWRPVPPRATLCSRGLTGDSAATQIDAASTRRTGGRRTARVSLRPKPRCRADTNGGHEAATWSATAFM